MRPPMLLFMARVRGGRRLAGNAGFTLVEIMVAITILLIGVLGVVTMVSAANKASTVTAGRQGALSLIRRVIETGRAVPYSSLKSTGLAGILQSQAPDLASTSGGGPWTVQRGGFTYTLTASVCLVDDGADGYGAHGASDPNWCADSTQTGTADGQSHDYKRLSVTASWTAGGQTKTLTQAGLVPSTGKGDLPATTLVTPTTAGTITSKTTTSVGFNVTAINAPATLSWLVDGQTLGTCPPSTSTCSGSGGAWAFTWGLGTPVTDTNSSSPNYGKCIAGNYVYDGTHTVSARAFTTAGLTGDAATAQVTLDRCAPIPPPNFEATEREKNTPVVDTEWTDSPEDDVIGYRVYRGTSTSTGTLVCPPNATDPPLKTTSCTDPNPPAYTSSPYYYGVYAYDRAPNGTERQGALSYINVNSGNKAPKAPGGPKAVLNADGTVSVTWTVPGSPVDPDTGDTIASFRIYRRDGNQGGTPSYTDRYDYDAIDAYCGTGWVSGTTCTFTDTATGGTQHTYNVTSVDTHLRESSYGPNMVK